jgi:hypothetical protein
MKTLLTTTFIALCIAIPAASHAQAKAEDKKAAEIAGHRAMAAAHEKAARCLEEGKPEKVCHAELEKDCRGLGIGKHCGMKHKH